MKITDHQTQRIDGDAVAAGQAPVQQSPVPVWSAAFAVGLAVVSHANARSRMKPLGIQSLGSPLAVVSADEFDRWRVQRIVRPVELDMECFPLRVYQPKIKAQIL